MIKYLPKNQYQGYTFKVEYEATEVYNVIRDNLSFKLEKEQLEKPLTKGYTTELYKDYGYDFDAYGYFVEDQLAGLVQYYKEWNGRVRIFELFVYPEYRQLGIAMKLMNHAKEKAIENKARAIILETQSCNMKAINLYQKLGYELGGLDTICYSNNDIENKEVRLEMILLLK